MSASAKPPGSTSAVVAGLQARHATALRSYALELWDGNARRADESLAALWREWAKTPPAAADASARETVFAALRRQIVAAQRRAGARAETEHETDGDTENANESATERIARRFRQLTPKQQEALRLRVRHGFGTDEIAHITDLSSAVVDQLIHHALMRLDGGSSDDPRLTRLALNKATAEETANESPTDRARIAELRVTLEVARQVLARGVETFVAQKRKRSRRTVFIVAGVTLVALVGVGFFLLRSPERNPETAATESVAASGASRVAIARSETENASAPSRAASGESVAGSAGNGGRGLTPRHLAHDAPAVSQNSTSGHQAPPAGQMASPTGNAVATTSATPSRSNTDSLARGGIPTGEVGRAEPLATPRGATDNEKIGGPPAPPPGTNEVASAPAEPRPTRSEPNADIDAKNVLPRGPGDEAPANSPNPTSVSHAASTAQAAPAIEASSRAPAEVKPLAADKLDTAPITALRKALGASRWPEARHVNVRALATAAPPAVAPTPPPDAAVFSARIESSESPLHPERRLVRVELRARESTPAPRAPATVILLLDVSGSMDAPNRLPLVQEAAAALLRRLRPEDRVGIVTYAGESRVLLPPEKLTDERAVREAINALEAKGRTNGGAGLREAFALAEADRRTPGEHVVILCTDGDFNMGETSEADLGALIDRHRDSGVRLAIFGFGRPDRIDARLEALAARAHGGSGYVNTRAEAEQALVSQLDALFTSVAEKLEATIEFDPARVARFRAVGEAELQPTRAGAAVPLATRDRVLPGEALAALFEIEPTPGAASTPGPADFRVRATCLSPDATGQPTPHRGLWPGRLGSGTFATASVDFRFAAAMAAFGEALQAGPDNGAPRLGEIERWARDAIGDDAGGYRAELIALIEQAQRGAKR